MFPGCFLLGLQLEIGEGGCKEEFPFSPMDMCLFLRSKEPQKTQGVQEGALALE